MNEGIELAVYRYDDPTVLIDYLPGRRSPKFLDELGNGAGSFQISTTDPIVLEQPNILDYRNVVKVLVDGKAVGAFLILKKKTKLVQEGGHAKEVYDVSGPGLLEWFEDAMVEPQGGLSLRSGEERYFNFAAQRGTWYKPAEWSPSVNSGKLRDRWWWAQQEKMLEKWPESANNVTWIWDRVNTNMARPNRPQLPLGTVYARHEFNYDIARDTVIYLVGDDEMEVFLDGIFLGKYTWISDPLKIEVHVPAGDHVLAVRGRNTVGGPAGFALAMYRIVPETGQEWLNRWTGTNAGVNDTWVVRGYPATIPGPTPGEILLTLMGEAGTRGVWSMDWLVPNFSATHDSNGVAWPADLQLDWSFKVGDSYGKVIDQFREMGLRVWVDPATLQLNVAVAQGTNRTADPGAVTFELGKNLRRAESDGSGLIKNYRAIKSNQGWVHNGDNSSVDKYGRLEEVAEFNTDWQTAVQMSSRLFAANGGPEEAAVYDVTASHEVPYIDYFLGDLVLAPDERGLRIPRRIVSISVEENNNGRPHFTLEFDVIARSNLEKLTNKINKATGKGGTSGSASGGKAIGGTTSPVISEPSSGGAPGEVPQMPTGLTSTSAGAWNSTGTTPLSAVTLSWEPVNLTTFNNEMIAQGYVVSMREGSNSWEEVGRVTGTTATIANLVPGKTYEFTVRALGFSSESAESSPHSRVAVGPTAPLAAPSTPQVSSSRALLDIKWDGKLGTDDPPPQFRYVFAEMVQLVNGSVPAGASYVRVGQPLQRGGGTITVTGLTPGQTYRTRLIAVDGVGIQSPPSPHAASAQGTVQGINLGSLEADVQAAIDAAEKVATDLQTEFDDFYATQFTDLDLAFNDFMNNDLGLIQGDIQTANAKALEALGIGNTAKTQADLAYWQARAVNARLFNPDTTFIESNGGTTTYRAGGGAVPLERVAAPAGTPTTSGFILQAVDQGSSTTGNASFTGFYPSPILAARAGAIFLQRFVARIPVGYRFVPASNAIGVAPGAEGLTPTQGTMLGSAEGTGLWQTYYRLIVCGTQGPFSSTGHIYVSGPARAGGDPLKMELAQHEVLDLTDTVVRPDILIQPTAPGVEMRKSTTLWIDTTGGNNTPKRWNGTAWIEVTDKVAKDAAAAAASASGIATSARDSANAKNRIITSLLDASGTSAGGIPFQLGDTWWKKDSLGNGGKVIAQWTYDATGWRTTELSHQVIASIDFDKGIFGTLDGKHLRANTIAAEAALFQSGNLFPDPWFSAPVEKWNSTNVSIISDASFPGGKALQILTSSVQRGSYYGGATGATNYVAQVEPGGNYRVRAMVNKAGTANTSLAIVAAGLNASGVQSYGIATLLPSGAPAGQRYVESTLKIPDGVNRIALGVFTTDPYAAGATYKIGDISIQRMAEGTLITPQGIDTPHLRTNSIYSEHVVIGSTENIIPNGMGEQRAAVGWAQGLTWDAAEAPEGMSGSFTGGKGRGTVQTPVILWDVEPNSEYLVELWVRADVPNSRLYVELRDQNNGHAGNNTVPPGYTYGDDSWASGVYPFSDGLIPTGWTRYAAIHRTNPTTNKMQVGSLYFNHPNGTERNAQVWMLMRVRPRVSAELMVDGSVLARHVGAGSIDTPHLRSKIITAEHVQAGSLTGEELAYRTITGENMTLGTLQVGHVVDTFGRDLVIEENDAIKLVVGAAETAQSTADQARGDYAAMKTIYDFGSDGAFISTPTSPLGIWLKNDKIAFMQGGKTGTELSAWTSGQMLVDEFVGTTVKLANHMLTQYPGGTVMRFVG